MPLSSQADVLRRIPRAQPCRKPRLQELLWLFTALIASGCNGDYGKGVPVSGNVTFNGEDLVNGSVTFVNDSGEPIAVGFIKNGAYSVNQSASYKGIPPGAYRVFVHSWVEDPGFIRPNGSFSPGVSRIPKKYHSYETSGFTADVGKSGGTFDFVLEGRP